MFHRVFAVCKRKMALLLFVSSVLITGCNNQGFTVSGTIEGAKPDEYLLLREVKPGFLRPVDSMTVDMSGKFISVGNRMAGILYAQHGKG